MTHQWDAFSQSLAEESIPRRQSLRLFGAALAGTVLSSFGLSTASAARQDPCKAFCRCALKRDQQFCLAACRACNGDTRRLCGSCGSHICTDFDNDVNNCGACGLTCVEALPYEYGECFFGACVYDCVDGAAACDGPCTPLGSDPDNCGACGNVCGGETPYCNAGICGSVYCWGGQALCSGICTDLSSSIGNCGGCGISCTGSETCIAGVCQPSEPWNYGTE